MMDNPSLLEILENLRSLPREAATVEFKRNWQNPGDMGEYISALANSAALAGHDRAWMVWGIDNDTHDVVGTRFDPFSEKVGGQAMVMWFQQLTSPKADFTFHQLDHPEGKVILLEIHPPRSAPIAFRNIRYIRTDSHKTKLSDQPGKEARLWERLGQKDDWSGAIVREATWEDLDPDAVVAARKRFTEYLIKGERESSRHEQIAAEVAEWNLPTLLNKAKLTKGGRITRSTLLLLGTDESSHLLGSVDAKTSWILRDGTGKTVSSKHFGPPFLLASERVFSQIRNLTIEEMPDGTLFPTAVQQYDGWVIREALHNCIAHQEYPLGGKANVVEYPDHLVFSNLGQFIPPSVEWMLENQSPPEHYRNQWLIDGMIRLRMIDQVGSGIRRMFETQRERRFPLPDYAFPASGTGLPRVEVAIQGRILDVKYTKLLMNRGDLNLSQVLLLDKVQKGLPISKEEATRLRKLELVEGRYPRIFVSGKIAAMTGGQAAHIRKKGFDNDYYRDLLEKLIREHGPVSPAVIQELFMDKLPESMTPQQKRDKIRNLTYELAHRREIIENIGAPRGERALWQIRENRSQPGSAISLD